MWKKISLYTFTYISILGDISVTSWFYHYSDHFIFKKIYICYDPSSPLTQVPLGSTQVNKKWLGSTQVNFEEKNGQ